MDVSADLLAVDDEIAALMAAFDAGRLKVERMTLILDILDKRRSEIVRTGAEAATAAASVSAVFRGVDEWNEADLGQRRQILRLYLDRAVIAPCGKGRQPAEGRGRISPHWSNGRVEANLLREMGVNMMWSTDAQPVA